jgi:hypothetical protein
MPSPIYQNVINLVKRLSVSRGLGVFTNAVMRERGAFDKFLDVAKFTTLTPLSLLIWCELSFPIVSLKISSLPTFALKSPKKFSCHT